MLVSLFAAALTAQTIHRGVRVTKPALKTTIPFVVDVPPIPFSQGRVLLGPGGVLHFTPSRKLIPLAATLTLDGPAQQFREEEDLVASINMERTTRGLTPLTLDPLLVEAARDHSREMCDLNYFDHVSPTLGAQTPADRYLDELHAFSEKRPAKALIGENIFFASVTNDEYNADYAHQRLMASPSHRQNILEPRFTKVGIGLYRDPQGQFWVTEMFLRDS